MGDTAALPQNKTCVVVGVGEGIGAALARPFAAGYKVALLARSAHLLKPSAIADTFWYLAHQDRSAWTHELDVRPFKEKF